MDSFIIIAISRRNVKKKLNNILIIPAIAQKHTFLFKTKILIENFKYAKINNKRECFNGLYGDIQSGAGLYYEI